MKLNMNWRRVYNGYYNNALRTYLRLMEEIKEGKTQLYVLADTSGSGIDDDEVGIFLRFDDCSLGRSTYDFYPMMNADALIDRLTDASDAEEVKAQTFEEIKDLIAHGGEPEYPFDTDGYAVHAIKCSGVDVHGFLNIDSVTLVGYTPGEYRFED